jgi:hypothetical protein
MHQTFRLLSLHTILNMTDRLRDIAGWRSEGRREEEEDHACQAAREREREGSRRRVQSRIRSS